MSVPKVKKKMVNLFTQIVELSEEIKCVYVSSFIRDILRNELKSYFCNGKWQDFMYYFEVMVCRHMHLHIGCNVRNVMVIKPANKYEEKIAKENTSSGQLEVT